MDIETYASWLKRQGHQIYRTESSLWYNAGPRVLQAFPYHWLITPSDKELNKLMVEKGIIALRYSTPLEATQGMASYHVVLHKPYQLENLRSQARNGVKKGAAIFKVERISFERLAAEGWKLQQDTLDRQMRLESMTQAQWESICKAASGLNGFEAWVATKNGELAAGLITAQMGDTFYVPYAFSHRQYLSEHVNNILFYTVSTDFLDRPGIVGIFFGLNSLDAPPSVDEFKFRMSIIPRPVRQRVVFHPMLSPFMGKPVHNLLVKLVQRYPQNAGLAKAEGMLRFHLKGKMPLSVQEWPEILADDKTRLVASIAAGQ